MTETFYRYVPKPPELTQQQIVWLELFSHNVSYSIIARLYDTYPMTVKRLVEQYEILYPATLSERAKQDIRDFLLLMYVELQLDATQTKIHLGAMNNRIQAVYRLADLLKQCDS